jgi:hypothetical protein
VEEDTTTVNEIDEIPTTVMNAKTTAMRDDDDNDDDDN